MRLIGADDVCEAVEATLRARLPQILPLLPADPPLVMPATLEQLPTRETLVAVIQPGHPALTVSSPGADPAESDPDGESLAPAGATWEVVVGVYASETDHERTATSVRRYVKAVRAALTVWALPGLEASVAWLGEEYDGIPDRDRARTLGAGQVRVAVHVPYITDLGDVPLDQFGTVATTHLDLIPASPEDDL